MNPIFESLTLPAGAQHNITTTASVLTVKTSTLAIQVAFNGGPLQPCAAGSTFTITGGLFSFTNNQAVPVVIGFWIGDKAVPFSPQDNSSSTALTYPLGNLGIQNGGNANIPNSAAGVTNITVGNAGATLGCMTVPAPGTLILISGTNNGHARQEAIFTVPAASPNPLCITDATGCYIMTIPPGTPPISLVTSSDLYISGVGGNAYLQLGQFFNQQ